MALTLDVIMTMGCTCSLLVILPLYRDTVVVIPSLEYCKWLITIALDNLELDYTVQKKITTFLKIMIVLNVWTLQKNEQQNNAEHCKYVLVQDAFNYGGVWWQQKKTLGKTKPYGDELWQQAEDCPRCGWLKVGAMKIPKFALHLN